MSNENKKLTLIDTYLNLFLGTLEEVVDDDGNIYLRESGDRYAKVAIKKKYDRCWVDELFWDEFSRLFSLDYDDVVSHITIWIEDTFQLKGIDIFKEGYSYYERLEIPKN